MATIAPDLNYIHVVFPLSSDKWRGSFAEDELPKQSVVTAQNPFSGRSSPKGLFVH